MNVRTVMFGAAELTMKAKNMTTVPAMVTGRMPHAFTMALVSGPVRDHNNSHYFSSLHLIVIEQVCVCMFVRYVILPRHFSSQGPNYQGLIPSPTFGSS